MDEDDCGEYMHVEYPVVLAAFVAFCGKTHRPVYLRGCWRNHSNSFPSLYRDGDNSCNDPGKRWSAYKRVLEELKKGKLGRGKLPAGTRWDRENLGAVLQHYGIKTPWLDVVRSIPTAIWFATHRLVETRDPSRRAVEHSGERHGWISLYVCSASGQQRLTVVDLMEAHSSQHVRPQAQHGLSLAMQRNPKNDEDHFPPAACTSDFNTHRIACVRFPARSERWKPCGHLFSARYLFPAPRHDDSLRQLRHGTVRQILEDARSAHELDKGTLGALYTVQA